MPAIPEETIRELREKVDIVDLIGRHVALKRSGKQYKGLCPFHGERTPSFYVDPNRHSFKCFGCGVWGDAIDFVQKVQGISFPEAMRLLAARSGVALPQQSHADVKQAEAREVERDAAYRVMDVATQIYRKILTEASEGQAGRAYVEARGIKPETSDTFALGYAPHPSEGSAGWDTLARELARRKLDMQLAERLGLVSRSERSGSWFDRFRGRLMFPILQPGGSTIAFSGRILPEFENDSPDQKAPKYLNSPETLLFKKSKTLFGLHCASRAIAERGRVILVEGNVDVLSLHQAGHLETVAPLGTALTEAQVALLVRFSERAILCFDGDRAGAKAAYAALPLLLDASMDTRIVGLDESSDPDSLAREDPERLEALLARPGSALEWFMRKMVAAGATESIEAQAKAVRALVPLLRKVKGRDARGDYAVLAANLLSVPVRRLWAAVEGQQAQGGWGPTGAGGHGPPPGSGPNPHVHSAPMRAAPLPSGQMHLTALLVDRPEVARVAERAGILDQVSDPRLRPIVQRVIEAALAGERRPSEGELLDCIGAEHGVPGLQQQLHRTVFSGDYLETEDPQAVLDEGLRLCERERLEREIHQIDLRSREARARGDEHALRELQQQKIALRREAAQMQSSVAP